jgi:hypothetical protein
MNNSQTTTKARAIRAYRSLCEREGWTYQQPSHIELHDDDRLIELSNSNGVLAMFATTPSGRIGRRLLAGAGGRPIAKTDLLVAVRAERARRVQAKA